MEHNLSLCAIIFSALLTFVNLNRNWSCSDTIFHFIAGSCIPLTWQCNDDKECDDGSDEEGCYSKDILTVVLRNLLFPPLHLWQHPGGVGS